ncbi:hypothetical protein J1605_022260 [Eschrichtius robustus]|uniref:Uncharacterized protein n=1 Tax=Eschrichtius robustus TaxID=9764 RepID=A0AB34HCV2_ESCRO|nr:hypothetical protein J1605_022260 [Eschrichtius robustus]
MRISGRSASVRSWGKEAVGDAFFQETEDMAICPVAGSPGFPTVPGRDLLHPLFSLPEREREREREDLFPYTANKQAFMQPHLLGNEFTHLEFPRRVQRKELGKKMLYRDFNMTGCRWAVFVYWMKEEECDPQKSTGGQADVEVVSGKGRNKEPVHEPC